MHHSKTMSDAERQRVVSQLDMTPISEEYELELRLVSIPITLILFLQVFIIFVAVVVVVVGGGGGGVNIPGDLCKVSYQEKSPV
jgi:hypothetical protein